MSEIPREWRVLGIRDLEVKTTPREGLIQLVPTSTEIFANALYEQTSGMPELPYFTRHHEFFRENTSYEIEDLTPDLMTDIYVGALQSFIYGVSPETKGRFGLHKGRMRFVNLSDAFQHHSDAWVEHIHGKMIDTPVLMQRELSRIAERLAVRQPTIDFIINIMNEANDESAYQAKIFEQNVQAIRSIK